MYECRCCVTVDRSCDCPTRVLTVAHSSHPETRESDGLSSRRPCTSWRSTPGLQRSSHHRYALHFSSLCPHGLSLHADTAALIATCPTDPNRDLAGTSSSIEIMEMAAIWPASWNQVWTNLTLGLERHDFAIRRWQTPINEFSKRKPLKAKDVDRRFFFVSGVNSLTWSLSTS